MKKAKAYNWEILTQRPSQFKTVVLNTITTFKTPLVPAVSGIFGPNSTFGQSIYATVEFYKTL